MYSVWSAISSIPVWYCHDIWLTFLEQEQTWKGSYYDEIILLQSKKSSTPMISFSNANNGIEISVRPTMLFVEAQVLTTDEDRSAYQEELGHQSGTSWNQGALALWAEETRAGTTTFFPRLLLPPVKQKILGHFLLFTIIMDLCINQ